MPKNFRKTFPLDPSAEAMLGIISEYTSERVANLLEKLLVDFCGRMQNDICDRVYDYVYYRGDRGFVGNSHADNLLTAVYDLHDLFLVQKANRSLASGYHLPESMESVAERARCCTSMFPDEIEMLIKCLLEPFE